VSGYQCYQQSTAHETLRRRREPMPSWLTVWRFHPSIIPPLSQLPHLPLEIIYKIIDEHFISKHDTDLQAIRTLSLVCCELARYCRPALFRCVNVCCPSSEERSRYWHTGSGWPRPTIWFTPSDFLSFLNCDSTRSLGSTVSAIEELHLFLPSIPTSDLVRRFGLDNTRRSTLPWL
jgi:hypothetical protein